MKNVALLLTSLLLIFSLTACGKDQQAGDVGGSAGTDTAGDSAAGTNDGIVNGGMTAGDNGQNAAGGAGDSVPGGINGQDSGTVGGGGTASTGGSPSTTRSTIGAGSYEQMLRNGRVHDRDGDLTDFENSVTPGASMF